MYLIIYSFEYRFDELFYMLNSISPSDQTIDIFLSNIIRIKYVFKYNLAC